MIHDEDNSASMHVNDDGWTIHRKRAWTAIMNQAHYDFIDFSITVGSETGTVESNRKIRTWMKHLSEFIHSFDFIHAAPNRDWIVADVPHTVCSALAQTGHDYVAYMGDSRELTDATAGQPLAGRIILRLPPGRYLARLFSPISGEYSPGWPLTGGQDTILDIGPFAQDIAVRVTRVD
jgi:hypothetical protein